MEEASGIKYHRLAVLLQFVFVPVYYVIYTAIWHIQITVTISTFMKSSYKIGFLTIDMSFIPIPEFYYYWMVLLGMPIIFSLPWMIFTWVYADRIANTYKFIADKLGNARLDLQVFYALNTSFALLFFILPYAGPLLSVWGIIFLIKYALQRAKIGKMHALVWLIPSLILAFIPTLVAMAFYFEYNDLLSSLLGIWSHSVDFVYGIALCAAIAIAYGDVVRFFKEIRVEIGEDDELNLFSIFLTQIITFPLAFTFYLIEGNSVVITYMNFAAIFGGASVIILRALKTRGGKTSIDQGFLIVPIFSLLHLVSTKTSQIIGILLSALLFVILFFVGFRQAKIDEVVLEKE